LTRRGALRLGTFAIGLGCRLPNRSLYMLLRMLWQP
jgi:hypothetical protein